MVNRDKICRWYQICPIKRFYEQGLIGKKWIEDYCFIANGDCVRKKMEEAGVSHPDNMLPDGNIDFDLK